MYNSLILFLILDAVLFVVLYFVLMRQADKFFEMYEESMNNEGE